MVVSGSVRELHVIFSGRYRPHVRSVEGATSQQDPAKLWHRTLLRVNRRRNRGRPLIGRPHMTLSHPLWPRKKRAVSRQGMERTARAWRADRWRGDALKSVRRRTRRASRNWHSILSGTMSAAIPLSFAAEAKSPRNGNLLSLTRRSHPLRVRSVVRPASLREGGTWGAARRLGTALCPWTRRLAKVRRAGPPLRFLSSRIVRRFVGAPSDYGRTLSAGGHVTSPHHPRRTRGRQSTGRLHRPKAPPFDPARQP